MSRGRVSKRPDTSSFVAHIRSVVAEELGQAGLTVKNSAIRTITQRDRVDTGDLLNGIEDPVRADLDGDVAVEVWSRAAHSIFVELGREPGRKAPPPAVIRGWVERRLGLSGQEADSAAYLIGQAIAKRGVPGTYFMRNAAESVDVAALAADIEKRLNQ